MKFKTLIAIALAFMLQAPQLSAQNVNAIEQISYLVQTKNYDAARQLLRQLSQNPDDYAFLESQIAESQGNYGDAIRILREVIARTPDFRLARFQLAQLLQIDKQFENARFQLEILRNQAANDEERGFFARHIQKIDSKQTYGFGVEFSAYPSSNINNASNAKTDNFWIFEFEIPEELRPQFGWQTGLGVNGYYRTPIQNQHEILTNFSTNLYRYSVDTIDYSTAYLSLNYHYQNARTDFRIGPYVRRFMGDNQAYKTVVSGGKSTVEIIKRDEDYTTLGLSASANYILSPRHSVGMNVGYSESTYDDQEQYKTRNSYDKRLGVNYRYSIDQRNLMRFELNYNRHVEAGYDLDWESSNSYHGFGAGLSLATVYPNQWQTEFGLSFATHQHDLDYYLNNDKSRRDEIWGADFSILNSKWQLGNFVPKLNCHYERTDSNIKTSQIEGGRCGVVLTTEF